jgi:hypothetical protein
MSRSHELYPRSFAHPCTSAHPALLFALLWVAASIAPGCAGASKPDDSRTQQAGQLDDDLEDGQDDGEVEIVHVVLRPEKHGAPCNLGVLQYNPFRPVLHAYGVAIDSPSLSEHVSVVMERGGVELTDDGALPIAAYPKFRATPLSVQPESQEAHFLCEIRPPAMLPRLAIWLAPVDWNDALAKRLRVDCLAQASLIAQHISEVTGIVDASPVTLTPAPEYLSDPKNDAYENIAHRGLLESRESNAPACRQHIVGWPTDEDATLVITADIQKTCEELRQDDVGCDEFLGSTLQIVAEQFHEHLQRAHPESNVRISRAYADGCDNEDGYEMQYTESYHVTPAR